METGAKPGRKKTIPKALREQVWLTAVGRVYDAKCTIAWCTNVITVHDFHCGHNIPESQGGATVLKNLAPICARCNLSMGNLFTIQEWQQLGGSGSGSGGGIHRKPPWWKCCVTKH
jgi:5-methylcytosine-specific restriction endonuclease McrA